MSCHSCHDEKCWQSRFSYLRKKKERLIPFHSSHGDKITDVAHFFVVVANLVLMQSVKLYIGTENVLTYDHSVWWKKVKVTVHYKSFVSWINWQYPYYIIAVSACMCNVKSANFPWSNFRLSEKTNWAFHWYTYISMKSRFLFKPQSSEKISKFVSQKQKQNKKMALNNKNNNKRVY